MKIGKIPPDAFLRCLSKAQRKEMFPGVVGMTAPEASDKYIAGQEKKLQQDIFQWLNMQDDCYVDPPPRMDKRTTLRKGRPDLVASICGLYVAIECKSSTGKLTPEQKIEHGRIRDKGGKVIVTRDLKSVVSAVSEIRARKIFMDLCDQTSKHLEPLILRAAPLI